MRGIRFCVFFFNDTATTEIYTLSLHDALPISRHLDLRVRVADPHRRREVRRVPDEPGVGVVLGRAGLAGGRDRKSTRLNSSHANISYAVFCLKKKKKNTCNIIYDTPKLTHLLS